MNLGHLQYFVDAVELMSCSLSAKKNRISQPALSQSIRQLEKELGHPLLKHRPKLFEVTIEGEVFLGYAKQILELVRKARSEVTLKDQTNIPLRIVCTQSFFKYYLKHTIPELRLKCPQYKVSVKFGNREMIKAALSEESADLGFFLSSASLKSFEVIKIGRGSFYEIALQKPRATEDLPLFVTSLKDKEIIKLNREKNKIRNVSEIGSWESIYELVTSGFGSGIVPDYIIRDKKIWRRKLIDYDLVMLRKKGKTSSFQEVSAILLSGLRATIGEP